MFGYAIFLRILNMSLTASVIIVFVLACRLLLRRIPKIYSYILWSVVIFRLLCPISISAPISLLGLVQAPVVKLDEDSLWTMQSVQLKDSILDQQVAKEKDFVGGVGFVEYISSDSGQVEECVYTTDGRSRFIFGQSEENIRKCIAFYSIARLTENIKVANLRLESAYMNDNIFEKL